LLVPGVFSVTVGSWELINSAARAASAVLLELTAVIVPLASAASNLRLLPDEVTVTSCVKVSVSPGTARNVAMSRIAPVVCDGAVPRVQLHAPEPELLTLSSPAVMVALPAVVPAFQ